jgi:hypothetical protein
MSKMTLDQLFNALPRDLQWEILSKFLGTHAVRKGKLIRKLVLPVQFPRLKYDLITNSRTFPWRYSKYGKISVHPEIPCFLSECVNIVSFVKLPDDGMVMYCEGTITKKKSYIYRTATKMVQDRPTWDHERFIIDESVILPPFIKHDYPSYPFTNKKMGRKS